MTSLHNFTRGSDVIKSTMTSFYTSLTPVQPAAMLNLVPWCPHVFLWVITPVYVIRLLCFTLKTDYRGTYSTAKLANSAIMVGLTCVQLWLEMNSDIEQEDFSNQRMYTLAARFVSGLLSILVVWLEQSRRCIHSVPMFMFWFLMVAADCKDIYTEYTEGSFGQSKLQSATLTLAVLVLVASVDVSQLLLASLPTHDPGSGEEHPHELASLPGKMFLTWVPKIVMRGFLYGLKEEDVPEVPIIDRCQSFTNEFQTAWKQEKERNKQTKRQSESYEAHGDKSKEKVIKNQVNLLRILYNIFGTEYFLLQGIKLLVQLLDLLGPVNLTLFITYLQHKDTQPAWKGYASVLTFGIHQLLANYVRRKTWTQVDRIIIRMRSSLELAVFRKVLTAKNECRSYITTGEVVTLVADDCLKLVEATKHLFLVFNAPIQTVLTLMILYNQVGVGAFTGLIIILIFIPVNSHIGKRLKRIQTERNDAKDRRVKIMNEILNGMKVLKLYAWEKSFLKRVTKIRDEEIDILKQISFLHAGIDFMFRACPFMVRAAGYLTFIYLGGHMDPSIAFATASLFVHMNNSLSHLYNIFPDMVMASESLERLNKFLNLDDIPEDIVTTDSSDEGTAIEITGGYFTWNTSQESFCLRDISFQAPRGGLTAVVGTVGCGKSSLLSAVLGEMEKIQGQVNVQGSVAYVPQEAWIQNATLKENILFGTDFDDDQYEKILDACALKDDLKLLAAGDKTLIGEKGVNLSGGQKQRVSLARAVYADTDVYLLDDPLSAVDAHVGKHIFQHVIGNNGVLSDKTRVMVTHGVHWLPHVDTVVVMKDGRISETGSYTQLMSRDGDFAQFVREVTKKKNTDISDYDVEHGSSSDSLDSFEEVTAAHVHIKEEMSDDSDSKPNIILKVNMENKAQNAVPTFTRNRKKHVTTEKEPQTKTSTDVSKDVPDENVEDDEDYDNFGNVNKRLYVDYVRAAGLRYVFLCVAMFIAMSYCRDKKTFGLADWADDPLLANLSLSHTPEYRAANWTHLLKYFALCFGEVVFAYFNTGIILSRGCEAARFHHNKLLTNILRSPMSFFDTTPNGKIITRFSKDIASVDGLNHCLRGYIIFLTNGSLAFTYTIYTNPAMVKFLLPVVALWLACQRMFLPSMRQIRRYRTKARPPVLIHMNETLNGVDSIRAYGVQQRFVDKMEEKMETSMKFRLQATWFWHGFGIMMGLISCIVHMLSGLMIMWDDRISPGMAGLVLNFANSALNQLDAIINHSVHTETEMISLEHVVDYSSKPTEASWETRSAKLMPAVTWPENGDIVMRDYHTRYREGLELVLKGVSCHIRSGEKIGIVGRTGAGKSSLTMALFRLIESVSGEILLSGQPIAPLGLHDLRSKLTILPQDPVIFGGTLKMNLDPFGESSDADIWEALKHAHLKDHVTSLPGQLEYECGEAGRNLSMGQRQLVCLARALLRHSHVLVLDEATAGVDMETDELIQATIRADFKASTVLTIAHRLHTILDYDRVMVLDQGRLAEFDTPQTLLADSQSIFYGMAKHANIV